MNQPFYTGFFDELEKCGFWQAAVKAAPKVLQWGMKPGLGQAAAQGAVSTAAGIGVSKVLNKQPKQPKPVTGFNYGQ